MSDGKLVVQFSYKENKYDAELKLFQYFTEQMNLRHGTVTIVRIRESEQKRFCLTGMDRLIMILVPSLAASPGNHPLSLFRPIWISCLIYKFLIVY